MRTPILLEMPEFGPIVALAGHGYAEILLRDGVMKRFAWTLRGFKRDTGCGAKGIQE
jgi:hypothetical protein